LVTVERGVRAAVAVLACAVLAGVAGGCSGSSTAPSTGAVFSQLDIKVGTGTEAATGNALTVNYTGWIFDATKLDGKGLRFDSSLADGRTPLLFTLGAAQVVAGWDQGVPGMKIGGVRRLVVPPSLAYGTVRSGPIPPNTTLVFEIELLDVQ
jgi:FKBP-type peptidyl-prolyl cis-trans isomerase FkpA